MKYSSVSDPGINALQLAVKSKTWCVGKRSSMRMSRNVPHPAWTGPSVAARFFTSKLPVGAGQVPNFSKAEDCSSDVPPSPWGQVFPA